MSHDPIVQQQSYGKSQVRVSRIHRRGDLHEFIELTVSIALDGDFKPSFSAADNSKIVATDTMKNTVYVLVGRFGIPSVEVFAQRLGRHFLDTYAHIDWVTIDCQEHPRTRITFAGKPHEHEFLGGSCERYTCRFTAHRNGETGMTAGLSGLQVLKTTGSGFEKFLRDQYTTLPETADRIFATSISATWPCVNLAADWSGARQSVRAALLDVFANQYSKSVQHTLYEMARAAFAACSLIDSIEIRMPNQHHLPVNLEPFGLKNANEVFVPTSEPFGDISATICRGE
jgi:urate oxidase